MRSGQSLIEVLVAIAVGTIMIIGAAALISPALRTSSTVKNMQAAAALGKELYENVRSVSEANWHSIDFLATSSANIYHLSTSTSPFTVVAGSESVSVGTSTYTRYFYLDDVYRNGSYKIDSTGLNRDPSTKKLTVVYQWGSSSNSIVDYLTRGRQKSWVMTDWSGGSNNSLIVTSTSTSNIFATSSGIDYTTSSGAVVVTGF